jgi:hypothetical protein
MIIEAALFVAAKKSGTSFHVPQTEATEAISINWSVAPQAAVAQNVKIKMKDTCHDVYSGADHI